MYAAITKRGDEIEKCYPELGQLFVKPYGDRLDLIKSKHPSGSFTLNFDQFKRSVSGIFKNSGSSIEFEMRPVDEKETVELWSGGQAHSDNEIVKMIFDQFMEEIA